jgi:two-component system nitrate/nitrite response regulator NarL
MQYGPRRTRVFLADEHPLFLKAVVDVVRGRSELELVGSAINGPDAAVGLEALEPDVAVLDMRLRGMSGHEVLAQLARRGSRTRVLFLSAHVERDVVYAALAGGAAGYVSKEVDGEALCDAIFAVANGETVLSPDVQRELAQAIRHRDAHERSGLTPREHAVLELAAEGLSTREIATRLNLASATIKTHLQSIYHKLDAPDRASAVAAAIRRGLLE